MNNAPQPTQKDKILAFIRANRFPEARTLCEAVCRSDTQDAEAWFLFGAINGQLGQFDDAIACCREAVRIKPDYADAHYNLAQACMHQGKYEEAIGAYRELLRIQPSHAEVLNNLGFALYQLRRHEEATGYYRRVLEINPQHTDALHNLGNALNGLDRLEEACAFYREAIRLKPDYVVAHISMGNALRRFGRTDEAIECYRQALRINPSMTEAHLLLGRALKKSGLLEEAIKEAGRALHLVPDNIQALHVLAGALMQQGRHEEARHYFLEALRINPDAIGPASDLLFLMNYSQHGAQTVFHAHRDWSARRARSLPIYAAHDNAPDPERRLRVGYVSPDFYAHSVAYFIEPLLIHHDRAQIEKICYSDVVRPDVITERLQKHAGTWRDVHKLSDAELAELIRQDRIDILVDLAGHTARNRLMAFARKPAPVQVTYLGYPNTTGLTTIDYRLTDAWADPPGQTEHLHTETLQRLSHGFLCFMPPPGVLPNALPARTTGGITFGSFNNLAKLTPEMIKVWARILHAVPGSRLLLKNHSFRCPETRQHIQALFARHGIARSRVEPAVWESTLGNHLAWYHRVDLALDTFPYHGTTTTCEALWMGVPVVTLAGQVHASRVGVSILSQAGLPDFIATDPEDYVARAVRWASDIDGLARLRAELHGRMTLSSLCNGIAFARDVEAAYREMWRKWCARPDA